MQISSPTQALNSSIEALPQDNSPVGSIAGDLPLWGHKAQKKNKSGIFAKLLEGLIGKGKKGIPGPDRTELTDVFGSSDSENTGEKGSGSGINTKKIRNSSLEFPIKQEILNGKDGFSGFSGFYRQDQLAEGSKNWQFHASFRDQRLFKRDFSFSGPSHQGMAPKEEGISVLFSEKEKGNRVSGLPLRSERGAFTSSRNSGGDKTKNVNFGNGVSNSLSFSFREMEAEILRSQLRSGMLKPANSKRKIPVFRSSGAKKAKNGLTSKSGISGPPKAGMRQAPAEQAEPTPKFQKGRL